MTTDLVLAHAAFVFAALAGGAALLAAIKFGDAAKLSSTADVVAADAQRDVCGAQADLLHARAAEIRNFIDDFDWDGWDGDDDDGEGGGGDDLPTSAPPALGKKTVH